MLDEKTPGLNLNCICLRKLYIRIQAVKKRGEFY